MTLTEEASLGQLMLARDAAYLRMRRTIPSIALNGRPSGLNTEQQAVAAEYARLAELVAQRRRGGVGLQRPIPAI
jgi:hypothetical protein